MVGVMAGIAGMGGGVKIKPIAGSANHVVAGVATANVAFNASGSQVKTEGGTPTNLGNWIQPLIGMAGYEIRATLTSGTNPTTGTMNTWQNLGTSRLWENSQAVVGTKTSTILFEIREAASGIVRGSASFQIEAERI